MIKVGDVVTCKHAVKSYYSDYGPNPKIVFEPGMIGVVRSITPKVCKLPKKDRQGHPELDGKNDFLVVDYCDDDTVSHSVGLNFCNAVKVSFVKPKKLKVGETYWSWGLDMNCRKTMSSCKLVELFKEPKKIPKHDGGVMVQDCVIESDGIKSISDSSDLLVRKK